MEKEFDVVEYARAGMQEEAQAVTAAAARLGDNFRQAVDMILGCQGKVVVTGVGKSGIAGHKIAATMACAGIPALFMHAAESFHGDLGVIEPQDVVIAISNSGSSDEMKRGLAAAFRQIGVRVIALTAKPESILGQHSDVILDISVPREFCPVGFSGTTSVLVTQAIGDALAMAVMKSKGTTLQQFTFLHQGGAVGSELTGGKQPIK